MKKGEIVFVALIICLVLYAGYALRLRMIKDREAWKQREARWNPTMMIIDLGDGRVLKIGSDDERTHVINFHRDFPAPGSQ